MKRTRVHLVFFAIMMFFSSIPSMCFGFDSLDEALVDDISGLVESGDIPSLHVCLVSDGNKWVNKFGDESNEGDVFLVGSVQKVFVAVSILQLYDDGLVELDDDVNMYMPFSIRHPEFPDTPITIRMLLSHRSGLDATLPSEFAYDWAEDNPVDWTREFSEDLIDISLVEWLEMNLDEDGTMYSSRHWVREPNTGYSYSNNGYKILMCILEEVTGQSIEDYMKENIFTPLQMENTGFDSQDFINEHATPHTRKYGNATNIPLPVWDGRYMLRSSASDMGNLMIALMNEGVYQGEKILERETVELMFSNTRSTVFIREFVRKLKRDGYGMGIEVCNHGILGHGGSTVGFTGEFYICPEKGVGVFRVSNVNAILDYTSRGWEDINSVNHRILVILMHKMDMLPLVDYIVLFPVIGIILVLFRNKKKIRGILSSLTNTVN